jgi:tRNA(fMet)-specific endonuclease VapC
VTPDEVPDGLLLVDTDVFSWVAWRRSRHDAFLPLIQGHPLALSFVTVAELRYGAIAKDPWSSERRAKLEAMIAGYDAILTATDAVCDQWARIFRQCRGRLSGQGQGVNDMWVAACALAQPEPVPVVTGNLTDFAIIADAFPELVLIHPDR